MSDRRRPTLSGAERKNLLDLVAGAGNARGSRQGHIVLADERDSMETLPACILSRQRQDSLRPLQWDPFFQSYESIGKNTAMQGGKQILNFNTYDYLDLNGHPDTLRAGMEAAQRYGFSASASRLVGGERPVHRELEQALADIYETQDCVAFVSGHATNVSTLATLFGPEDCIVHDSLAHNSLVQGALLSRANRIAFPHNDMRALADILSTQRPKSGRTVIVSEGLFSMDGCVGNLPELIALKKRYHCILMIDEAHSLGTLGRTGRGVWEHFGVNPQDVDLWMGTLSKTTSSCGGFIAAKSAVVHALKHLAPGFVFSVGMSPPLAAAALEALRIMLREPQRVARLQSLSRFFLDQAAKRGLDTGRAQGHAVAPIMVGTKAEAFLLAKLLAQQGISVMPLAHPAVEENAARLRFFLSAAHHEQEIEQALDAIVQAIPYVREMVKHGF